MKGEPNSIWIASDIDVTITMNLESIPKDEEALERLASAMSPFLMENGGSWARYILFDGDGDLKVEINETFVGGPKKKD